MTALTRLLGDSPVRLLVKLLVLSFLVGLAMSAFGWSPYDVLDAVAEAVADVWDMGFGALERAFSYVLLGAAVVVPVFILLRIVNFRR